MKFVKGMLVGGLISAGVAMVCAGTMEQNKKKVMKKGKQFARKLGLM
jgi:gas vesicle protein